MVPTNAQQVFPEALTPPLFLTAEPLLTVNVPGWMVTTVPSGSETFVVQVKPASLMGHAGPPPPPPFLGPSLLPGTRTDAAKAGPSHEGVNQRNPTGIQDANPSSPRPGPVPPYGG